MTRSQWGADAKLRRRGHPIGPGRRTEVFVHHTASVDRDDTPNEWETLAEVKSRMRRLQTIRPELGLDVPYNMVAFFMADGELVLCEGRGLHRTGAHTRNHNRAAIGVAFAGNFENAPLPRNAASQLADFAGWLRDLRNRGGFNDLGYSRPRGQQVWGHRDASKAKTVCPGRHLYAKLPDIRFIDGMDDSRMDKPTWKLVQRALQDQQPPLYAGRAVDGRPGRYTHIAVRAFEKRVKLAERGVIGTLNESDALIWPATRELLLASAAWA